MKAIAMTANVTAIADRRSKMKAIAMAANVTAIADRRSKMKAIAQTRNDHHTHAARTDSLAKKHMQLQRGASER